MPAERGFSERDHIMKDSQCIQTLKNGRIVEDYMKANMYSPDTLSIDSDLVFSLSRDQEKKEKIADKEVQMKLLDSDISDLKSIYIDYKKRFRHWMKKLILV